MKKNISWLCIVCLISCIHNTLHAYKYDYVICAIFQNEGRFLKEWIEYHKVIGFQHFYLYNNLSTDNYREVLQPYIEKGEVEVIDWYIKQQHGKADYVWQHEAYKDALVKMNGIAKWAAFIDLDEFIVPIKGDTIGDIVDQYEHFDHIAGVSAKWNMFGHSKVEVVPADKLLIEMLTMYNPKDVQTNYPKTIVRPERVGPYRIMHFMNCKPGYHAQPLEKDICVINHYWTGDLRKFVEKKIPLLRVRNCKDDNYGQILADMENTIRYGNSMNVTKDTTILKYADKLRAAMFGEKK